MPFAKQENALGIGILGCGPIAQFAHLEAVQKSRNVVLRAVCDADAVLNKAADGGADIADGVASVRAMAAIANSVATGKPVTLAEVSGAL